MEAGNITATMVRERVEEWAPLLDALEDAGADLDEAYSEYGALENSDFRSMLTVTAYGALRDLLHEALTKRAEEFKETASDALDELTDSGVDEDEARVIVSGEAHRVRGHPKDAGSVDGCPQCEERDAS